jgi:hypothetical protein
MISNLNLGRNDERFLHNLEKLICNTRKVTTNQVELVNKLIEKYQRQLNKHKLFSTDLLVLPWETLIVQTTEEYTSAHIGIAMGKKGTEIAKQAASLILLEDDLASMVDAVAMGRKIYTNLKKAIQYIISIHIPIILTVFIPLVLGWIYPNIFSPIHVIFLEIIMGPTCSIIYENEPLEKNAMLQKPKAIANTFFNWKELSLSIIQGLTITIGTLFIYQYSVYLRYNEELTRTMVFSVLVIANIFLTLMLIPYLGLISVVIATGISYFVVVVGTVYWGVRKYDIRCLYSRILGF